ncbi:DUF3891 family protein [Alteribacter natronophilus]|uniref:DUF3891 family protein n=1 Tax=Alteribacter natronophilus TaxID=2583810 RepID=UPI00110E3A0E|nr:DUF3891 family protein [Alteribacter natronophilus]TMW73354.1 DUF3891 family protein [Alteribacter natronophilus]
MIVREEPEGLTFFEQDRHAHISGIFAGYWRDDLFINKERRDSVILAVTQHDRGWAELDRELVTGREKGIPLSFTDYPLKKKISAYRKGVDDLEQTDPYSAFLVSCHYASFFEGKGDPHGREFLHEEKERQFRLRKKLQLGPGDRTACRFHFDLLQLCDNLSLYICMNRWGTAKEDEIPWFKDGFPQQLERLGDEKVTAEFLSPREVSVSPWPFCRNSFNIYIPYKYVEGKDVKDAGSWEAAYRNAEHAVYNLSFHKK